MLSKIQQAQEEGPFIIIKNYRKTKPIERKVQIKKNPKQVPPITIRTRRMLAPQARQMNNFQQEAPMPGIQQQVYQQENPVTPRVADSVILQINELQMKEVQYGPLMNESLGFDVDHLLGFTGSKVNEDMELLQ